MIGIYKIENNLNHKIYIGQSTNIERRWREHCNPSTNSVISDAIKKYGKDNVSFCVLEECSQNLLDEREEFYIKKYNCISPNGYNIKDYNFGCETMYLWYDVKTFQSIVSDIKNALIPFQDIGEKYGISKRTLYYINRGEVHYIDGEHYPLRNVDTMSKPVYHCNNCGKRIATNSYLCKGCSNIFQRKVARPSRDELKCLIRTNSFRELGNRFGVSDKAVSKWCVSYNLPSRRCDINNINDDDWVSI